MPLSWTAWRCGSCLWPTPCHWACSVCLTLPSTRQWCLPPHRWTPVELRAPRGRHIPRPPRASCPMWSANIWSMPWWISPHSWGALTLHAVLWLTFLLLPPSHSYHFLLTAREWSGFLPFARIMPSDPLWRNLDCSLFPFHLTRNFLLISTRFSSRLKCSQQSAFHLELTVVTAYPTGCVCNSFSVVCNLPPSLVFSSFENSLHFKCHVFTFHQLPCLVDLSLDGAPVWWMFPKQCVTSQNLIMTCFLCDS